MPVARDNLLDWVAAHLVAAGVPLSGSSLYNAYRLLIHEDPAVLGDRQRQEYIRPDPDLRNSLLVLDSQDFPYVTRDTEGLMRLAERVQSAGGTAEDRSPAPLTM